MPKAQSVKEWFETVDPKWEPLVSALRDEIEKAGPGLDCRLAWGFPCWSGRERVFSIAAHKNHCNLQLWYGASLAQDFPASIEGTGKALRHVKFRELADITAEVKALIRSAIRLDELSPQKVP